MCLIQDLSGQSARNSHASNLLCTPDRHCITHQEATWLKETDVQRLTRKAAQDTQLAVSSWATGLGLRLQRQEDLMDLNTQKGVMWYLCAADVTLFQSGEPHQRHSLVWVCCQAPVPDWSIGKACIQALRGYGPNRQQTTKHTCLPGRPYQLWSERPCPITIRHLWTALLHTSVQE